MNGDCTRNHTLPPQESEFTKRKCDDEQYDNAPETQAIILPDGGILTFTKHFKYLGNYISYSLCDDLDIKHRLAQASATMGALREFCIDQAVETCSKYLIFCAIPINLLLWGCEIWAIRESLFKKLEVFFHRSIRNILGISIMRVKDEHITNETVCLFFCGIPSLWSQIAKRQLGFIGKVVRNHDSQIPTQLLTVCCNHPRKQGVALQTNKRNITKNLQLIIPSAEKDGRLSSWAYYALDKSYWDYLLSQLGNEPSEWDGAMPRPDDYTPLPRPPQHPPAHRHHHRNAHVPTHIRHLTLTPHPRHCFRRHRANLHQHLVNHTKLNGTSTQTE